MGLDIRLCTCCTASALAGAAFAALLAAYVSCGRQEKRAAGGGEEEKEQETKEAEFQPLRIQSGYIGLVGNTPMIRLKSLSEATGCDILVKVEFLNPGGTGKDRIALGMMRAAERSGKLKPGGTVVEGTSGSTGIALAALCRARGYRCVITMPDDQADEKVTLLEMFGAQVVKVRTASISNPGHYVNVAATLARETPGAVFMDQFENEANVQAHYENTGPEVWQQSEGRLDAFVMGAGTGGTISGVSRFLKERKPQTQVYLVDPPGSGLANKVNYGVCYTDEQAERKVRRHRYDTIAEGIGLDRITHNFNQSFDQSFNQSVKQSLSGSSSSHSSRGCLIDCALTVSDQAAVHMAHFLLQEEGLFVGCSSAMNLVGAVEAARRMGPGHSVVTVLCDSGQRSLSRFWHQPFIEARGLVWPPSQRAGQQATEGGARQAAEGGEEKEGRGERTEEGTEEGAEGPRGLEAVISGPQVLRFIRKYRQQQQQQEQQEQLVTPGGEG